MVVTGMGYKKPKLFLDYLTMFVCSVICLTTDIFPFLSYLKAHHLFVIIHHMRTNTDKHILSIGILSFSLSFNALQCSLN